MQRLPAIDELRAFSAIHRLGGFARAAQYLGLSQPAVSNRIRSLEDTLGTPVFEIPRRRIILTPAGRELVAVCDEFLPEMERVVRSASGAVWPDDEPLRIACPGAFGRFVVFPILYEGRLAEVPVRLLFRRPDEICRMVEVGEVELGITYETRIARGLHFDPICDEEFVLVRGAGGSEGRPPTLTDLEQAPFVTYEECDYVFGAWFESVMGEQPRDLRSVSHFERIEEVLGVVALGRGLSIVPMHAVLSPWTAEVATVPYPKRCWNREFVVVRPGRTQRPEVEQLLQRLSALP